MADKDLVTDEDLQQFWSNCLATFRMNGGVLLWQNSDPTADFASQNVTLSQNLSNFDYIIIGFLQGKTDKSVIMQKFRNLPNVTSASAPFTRLQYTYSNGTKNCNRYVGRPDDTHINFQDCYANGTVSNADIVPVYIYGSNDLGYIGQGTQVIANPTLAGTESELKSVGINGTNYYLGEKPTLIWLNANSNANQSATTLTNLPDMSGFKYLVIEYRLASGCIKMYQKVLYNTQPSLNIITNWYVNNTIYVLLRSLTVVSATSISIGDCNYKNFVESSVGTANNTLLITAIYATNTL